MEYPAHFELREKKVSGTENSGTKFTHRFAGFMVEFCHVYYYLSTCHPYQEAALMNIEECRKVLGITPGASLPEIKQAYKILSRLGIQTASRMIPFCSLKPRKY